jgi:hypothetical protein
VSTTLSHAATLFVTLFVLEACATFITRGVIRDSYTAVAFGQAGAWGLWIVTVKIVVAASSPVEYAAVLAGPVAGALTAMWLTRGRALERTAAKAAAADPITHT